MPKRNSGPWPTQKLRLILSAFLKPDRVNTGGGDQFLGMRVPHVHKVARKFKNFSLNKIETLLHSKYHEERFCALIILVFQFEKAEAKEQKKIYKLYLENTSFINNWDLVDASAHKIIGSYLQNKKRDLLYHLA